MAVKIETKYFNNLLLNLNITENYVVITFIVENRNALHKIFMLAKKHGYFVITEYIIVFFLTRF